MYRSSVIDALEITASKYPNKKAIVDEKMSVSWSEFRNNSLQVAQMLLDYQKTNNITGNRSVVIYMDKNVSALQAIFGVIYRGCYYTPIDVKMPLDRVEKILDSLKPTCIIADAKNASKIQGVTEIAVLSIDDASEANVDEAMLLQDASGIIDTDLLYVFYTSGSTGSPKGVMLTHRAVLDFVDSCVDTFDITEKEIIGNQGAFYFDLSTLDIYCASATGATLHIIPKKFFKFPIRLLEYIAKEQINMIYWVPSALVVTANMGTLGSVDISCLKKVTFCGEVMPCKQLNMWMKELPEATFVNMYGPTETTCASTYYVVNRAFEDTDSLPIGVPFKNTRVYLMDDNLREVKLGEIGEICIEGTSLAEGYFGDAQKTKEAFREIDINGRLVRVYRTGDLAKYNEFGELIYISRKDFQIKHMGHRIELGEIETAINVLTDGSESCCVYDDENKQIVAFVAADMSDDELLDGLKKAVPAYMVPGRIVTMPAIPHNNNGKIDRAGLKGMLL